MICTVVSNDFKRGDRRDNLLSFSLLLFQYEQTSP